MEQKELFNKYSNIIQESVSSKKENHYLIWLDDYIKLEKENEQLRLILGNQVRIKEDLLERINKAIEYMNKHEKDGTLWFVKTTDKLLEILKDGDTNE